jgi:hypothetical protein
LALRNSSAQRQTAQNRIQTGNGVRGDRKAAANARLLRASWPSPGNLAVRKNAWWGWEDSNLQPDRYERHRYEAAALAIGYDHRKGFAKAEGKSSGSKDCVGGPGGSEPLSGRLSALGYRTVARGGRGCAPRPIQWRTAGGKSHPGGGLSSCMQCIPAASGPARRSSGVVSPHTELFCNPLLGRTAGVSTRNRGTCRARRDLQPEQPLGVAAQILPCPRRTAARSPSTARPA